MDFIKKGILSTQEATVTKIEGGYVLDIVAFGIWEEIIHTSLEEVLETLRLYEFNINIEQLKKV